MGFEEKFPVSSIEEKKDDGSEKDLGKIGEIEDGVDVGKDRNVERDAFQELVDSEVAVFEGALNGAKKEKGGGRKIAAALLVLSMLAGPVGCATGYSIPGPIKDLHDWVKKERIANKVDMNLDDREFTTAERARYEEGLAYEREYILRHGRPSISAPSRGVRRRAIPFFKGQIDACLEWEIEQESARKSGVRSEGTAEGIRRHNQQR